MKLSAQELRIGNIIYYHGTNGPRNNINKIDAEDIFLMSTHPDYLTLHAPIPLTEEWLLKFGFEIYPWGLVKKSSKGFGVRINLKSFSYDVSGNIPVKIKYVHQLQNLYFALTGEELTINK